MTFLSLRKLSLFVITALAAWAVFPAWGPGSQATVAAAELTALSDDELGEIEGGELLMSLEDFDVFVHDNEAGMFTMDIAQSAFNGAQGVFTTLQTVNSAVDLNVVVNIYLTSGP